MSAAWREPMVWLMLAIPAATVVAGIATLRIARADGSLDAAPEAVSRVLQAQVADTSADARAAALGLEATITRDADGRWRIDAPAHVAGEKLALTLVHPTRARDDLHWNRDAGHVQWHGPSLPARARGRLILQGERGWRLVGHWPADGGTARLAPAVGAP